MGIEKLEERIVKKSQREATLFLEKEKRKIKQELEQFEKQKNEEFEADFQKFLVNLENEKQRKIDQATLDMERKLLEEKRNILDNLFLQVEDQIVSLDEDSYIRFLESLIIKDAPSGKSILFVNKRDHKLFDKRIIDEMNKKLGKNKSIGLSPEIINIKGGCIIKGSEVEIDDSIHSLVQELREKMEIDIAKKVFEGQNER